MSVFYFRALLCVYIVRRAAMLQPNALNVSHIGHTNVNSLLIHWISRVIA